MEANSGLQENGTNSRCERGILDGPVISEKLVQRENQTVGSMNLVENQGSTQNIQLHLLGSKSSIDQKLIRGREADDTKVNVGEKGLVLLSRSKPERNDNFLFTSSLLLVMPCSEKRVSSVGEILSLCVAANLEEGRLLLARMGEKGREIVSIVEVVLIIAELSSNIDLDLLEESSSEKVARGKVVALCNLHNSSIFIGKTIATENITIREIQESLVVGYPELERASLCSTYSIVLYIARRLYSSYRRTGRE